MPNTPNLGLTMMAASQAQKEVVFNNAIIAFDALFKGSVIDVTLTAPPASPALGDAYIVAAGGSGAWSGKDQAVAVYFNGWQFFGPAPGQLLWSMTQAAYFLWKNATLGWNQVPAVAVTALSDMTDVGNAGHPTSGQFLGWSTSLGKWTALDLKLKTLPDVDVIENSDIDGFALVWSNTPSKWQAKKLANVAFTGSYGDLTNKPALTIASLADVNGTPANGQVLVWNAGDGKWEPGTVAASGGGGGGGGTLAGDTDVALTSPGNTDQLTYDSGAAKWKNTKARYDLALFIAGTMTNGEVLLRYTAPIPFTIPKDATNSHASASTAAGGSTVLTIKQDNTPVGTITFGGGGQAGIFSIPGDINLSEGTLLTLLAPATADPALADVGITLAGYRR